MFKHIFTKIIIFYIIFLFLGFISVEGFVSRSTRNTMIETEAEHLYNEATLIATNYGSRYYTNTITFESLYSHLELAASNLSSDIWIVNSDGTMLTSIQQSSAQAPSSITNFDISVFGENYYMTGNFFAYFDSEYLSVYAPITFNYRVVGYVFIHEPTSNFENISNASINITYKTALLIFGLSLIPLFGVYITIVRPVKKIVAVSNEYNTENFKPQAISHTDDEIGYISNTISFMANKLDSHEDVQRKFISNISHDFRSPLTSIRGYIEAMTDGTIPEELYPKYLNIILNETERLTKLTNNLLDLNRIGSKDAHLEYSTFDINEIIRKCALSSEVQCDKKNLSIELNLYNGTMFVHADETKIQQVIYNLLDNAIKFSTPSTTIKIETVRKNNKLLVSIQDHGIGIPKDALDNIWNRFYKSDLSRGKDKKGTGLGLSIVKEIIQAHNQSINVVSTVDVGTEFIFTLDLAEQELDEDIF